MYTKQLVVRIINLIFIRVEWNGIYSLSNAYNINEILSFYHFMSVCMLSIFNHIQIIIHLFECVSFFSLSPSILFYFTIHILILSLFIDLFLPFSNTASQPSSHLISSHSFIPSFHSIKFLLIVLEKIFLLFSSHLNFVFHCR